MTKITEAGYAIIAGIVLAIAFGVIFSSVYPLVKIDSALATLFFLVGLSAYGLIRLALSRFRGGPDRPTSGGGKP